MENSKNSVFYLNTRHKYDNDNLLKISAEKLDLYYCIALQLSSINLYKNIYGHEVALDIVERIFKKIFLMFSNYKVVYSYGEQVVFLLEFTTLHQDAQLKNSEVFETVDKLLQQFDERIALPDIATSILIKTSIGACFSDVRGNVKTLLDLIKYSEIAMEHSKLKNTFFTLADDVFIAQEKDDLELSSTLIQGIDMMEFSPYYQPIIDTKNNIVVACDCFPVWEKDKYRIIPASRFAESALNQNLLHIIDQSVIEKAILDYSNWVNANIVNKNFIIVFNLSRNSLFKLDFSSIYNLIVSYNISSENFQFCIEGPTIKTAHAISKLQELKTYGFKLAIDNFGSCQTPTTALLKVNFDTMKLSNMLLPKYEVTSKHKVLSRLFIELAEDLQCDTVAQGIENKEQLAFINNYNFGAVQGYYFTPPIKASEIKLFLLKYINGLL